jgi:hypothetical protein
MSLYGILCTASATNPRMAYHNGCFCAGPGLPEMAGGLIEHHLRDDQSLLD